MVNAKSKTMERAIMLVVVMFIVATMPLAASTTDDTGISDILTDFINIIIGLAILVMIISLVAAGIQWAQKGGLSPEVKTRLLSVFGAGILFSVGPALIRNLFESRISVSGAILTVEVARTLGLIV